MTFECCSERQEGASNRKSREVYYSKRNSLCQGPKIGLSLPCPHEKSQGSFGYVLRTVDKTEEVGRSQVIKILHA